MAQEEKNTTPNKGNDVPRKQETLEERLRRIEAEAARKAQTAQKAESKPKVEPRADKPEEPKKTVEEPAKDTKQTKSRSSAKKLDTQSEKVEKNTQSEEKKPAPKPRKAKPKTTEKPAKKEASVSNKEVEAKAEPENKAVPRKPDSRAKTNSASEEKTPRKAPVRKSRSATTKDTKSKIATEEKPAETKSTTRRAKTSTAKKTATTSKTASAKSGSRTTNKSTAKSTNTKRTSTKKTDASSSDTRAKSAKEKTTTRKKPVAKSTSSSTRTTTTSRRKASPAAPDSDKQLVINSTPTQVEIALMENGKLVELHHQKTNNNFTVGDIFLGRIKRLMPGLNAAFVDIGHKKDAFLHYTDLGPKLRSLVKFTEGSMSGKLSSHTLDKFKLEPEIIKTGKIDQVLNKRDSVLVQVLKEPIGTKGPRLSCEITIPGRFLVLTPFVDVIAVSKKIGNSEERKRLKMLIESIKPKNFGVIVRTAAEGKNVKDLHEELKLMMDKWESMHAQLKGSQPPMKLLSELDKASSILRDILNDSFNNITVNDKDLYSNIRNYMGSFAPDKVNIVNLHKTRKPIFDTFGVTKQIKSSFGKTATMGSGAYLVIEHTEAMHVIDVNSGHKMSSANQEEAVLSVNLESAEEIARQMRLRDIGGIIIVDFIDMRNKDHKQELVTSMRRFMKKDRAQHTILPLSKFGLMQITRQRVRPEVKINTAEICPSCKGTGKINPSILLTDELERDLKFILQSRPKSKLVLHVHPYIEAFLKKGFISIQRKWYLKFYKWIAIRSNADFSMTEYKFFDGNEDEIRLK